MWQRTFITDAQRALCRLQSNRLASAARLYPGDSQTLGVTGHENLQGDVKVVNYKAITFQQTEETKQVMNKQSQHAQRARFLLPEKQVSLASLWTWSLTGLSILP